MCLFLIAVMLQAAPQPQQTIKFPDAPKTVTHHVSDGASAQAPQIGKPATSTTPGLNDEEMLHISMEKDISGQGEALGELKSKVGSLEDKREKMDRPDIDDLKTSRTHIEWSLSVIAFICGTIWFLYERYKQVLWTDVIRPRIIRALQNTPDSATHS
jgi:hypothetical protein